jgi:hypothetical protein
MSMPEDIGPAIVAEVERCRQQVIDRVRQARDLSEKGVIAAGSAIQGIVEQSKSAMAEAAGSMEAAGRNDDHLRSQVAELRSYLVEQDRTVERALGRTSDIAKAGAAIKAMAAASRLLALNARVEAARLDGENRVAFGVIADEMRELSNGVEATNRSIAKLATELLEVLPQIRDQAQQMQTYFDKFHQEIQGRAESMNETFTSSLTRNEAYAERIRKLAYDGLSHLAFQDPMIQSLQRIEKTMLGLESVIGERISGNTSELKPVAEVHAPVVAEEPPAGDVMLF